MKIEGTGIPPASRPGKPYQTGGSRETADRNPTPALPQSDELEISSISRGLAALPEISEVREELISEILKQLDTGEYLNGEKLQTAAMKLLGYL